MRKRFCFKRQKRFSQFGIFEEMLMYFTYKSNTVYSGLNLNQDKATKPQTVQIVR